MGLRDEAERDFENARRLGYKEEDDPPEDPETTSRTELQEYSRIVSEFTELLAVHVPLIGDCSDLPHPKDKIMYAICWVREHYATIRDETETKQFRNSAMNLSRISAMS